MFTPSLVKVKCLSVLVFPRLMFLGSGVSCVLAPLCLFIINSHLHLTSVCVSCLEFPFPCLLHHLLLWGWTLWHQHWHHEKQSHWVSVTMNLRLVVAPIKDCHNRSVASFLIQYRISFLMEPAPIYLGWDQHKWEEQSVLVLYLLWVLYAEVRVSLSRDDKSSGTVDVCLLSPSLSYKTPDLLSAGDEMSGMCLRIVTMSSLTTSGSSTSTPNFSDQSWWCWPDGWAELQLNWAVTALKTLLIKQEVIYGEAWHRKKTKWIHI